MIKAAVASPSLTNVYERFLANMKKYLPDDVELVEVLDVWTKTVHPDHDVVITYNGNGSYYPQNAYISPKAVISERADDITMSYFTEKDVLFSYNYTDVDRWREAGLNACFWPRPIDPELFYPDAGNKDILVMTAGFHGEWIKKTDKIVTKLGGQHLVMALPRYYNELNLNARYDYCWPNKHDDILRRHYSSSQYVVSFVEDFEYRPGHWSCGIELGLAEAVFCGSVPIILESKRTDYMHKWLDGLALWIDPDNFDEELEVILSGDYIPITEEQRVLAFERFGAEAVMNTFWDVIRKALDNKSVYTTSSWWDALSVEKAAGFLARDDKELAKTTTVTIADKIEEMSLFSVLDIGCGPGIDAEYFARRFGSGLAYTGIDATAQLITLARKRLEGYPCYPIQKCDLFDLEDVIDPTMQYDVVLCKNVLEHCRPPDMDSTFNYVTAMDHICSVSSGYIFLGFFNGLHPSETITEIKDGVVYNTFGYREISDLLESHNLDLVERIDIIPNSVQTLLICKNREAL